MTEQQSIVYVIDDDSAVRNAVDRLIRSVGLKVRTFVSADEFLAVTLPDVPSCLILDVRMPGMSGVDLHNDLIKRDFRLPVVFITGHGDIPMAVQVIKAGAIEFLTKPFRDQDLLDAIQQAIMRDRNRRKEQEELVELRRRFGLLTRREREVMRFVVAGLLNKQIAAELGTSETTVKIHRGQVMHKMQAESVPDLVRMAAKLDLPGSD
ncbi:MAG TPA: response regulator transcription factor [Candidatus Acidoferrales bacterium]|jgi:FixJ family two-component response regulator|nr:response regulator transcription factor [Candidatus Acidoferrales bacterium]